VQGWEKGCRDEERDAGMRKGMQGWRKGCRDEERDAGMKKGMQGWRKGCRDEERDAGMEKGMQGWRKGCRDEKRDAGMKKGMQGWRKDGGWNGIRSFTKEVKGKIKNRSGGRERKGSEKWKSHRDRVEQIDIVVGSVQEMHPWHVNKRPEKE
jgi:hypothetical protein